MKDKILFITAWIKSHIIPSFYLAEILADQYQIYYAVPDEVLKELVTNQGYEAVESTALRFAHGLEREDLYLTGHGKDHKISSLTVFSHIATNAVYRKRERELTKIINTLQPSAVFLDVFSSTDFLILFPLATRMKIFFFCPMLSTDLPSARPATRTEGFWQEGLKGLQGSLNLHEFLKQKLTVLQSSLLAASTLLQIKWIMHKNKIPQKHSVAKNQFSVLFKGIPQILLAPQELEYEPESKTDQHYLGLCVSQRKDIAVSEAFEAGFQRILQDKSTCNIKLIYCAFGSYSTDTSEQKDVFYFIVALMEAIGNLPGIRVVCSVGSIVAYALEMHRVQAPNFYCFSRVPQLQVLSQSDLFITHGGFNSIKESIYYEVPMLVFPLDLKYDQPGNGSRIEYHGLGLKGDLRKDEPDEIKEKIDQLLCGDRYKKRMKEFHREIKHKYTAEAARHTLHQLFEGSHRE